jgi:lipopolysaccharide transport system ATP-binding protein
MARAVAITCQGVSKSFALVDAGNAWRLAFSGGADVERYHALSDVSFDVPKGQFMGVLGRNGAGKSTLLRVIGGVYAPDRGRAVIHGALSGLYELGLVGNPQLTGRAYADRLLTVHGRSQAERAAMIADIHDFSELGGRFDDPVLTYSAGMCARLFFATATSGCYDVYLLDEILSVGDQHFQAKCWRRMRERVSRGASGVLVTHDWSAIIRLCETAHVLDKGRVVFSGPSERAARRYLYGEAARSTYQEGVARFERGSVRYPLRTAAGQDFRLLADCVIETPAEVGAVTVIERLQPGFGWETALMSRAPTRVGATPGRYELRVDAPALPLEPGAYQISLHLFMPSPDNPRARVILDGFSWLDGDGLPLEVTGREGAGLVLPTRWSLTR